MTSEEYEKWLTRARKCIALANSSNPHEAAAALGQAQKIMAMLGITNREALAEQAYAEVVKTKEYFNGSEYLSYLANLIQCVFGVVAVREQGAGKKKIRANIRYIGAKSRVLMAVYAHRVVDNAVRREWADHILCHPYFKTRRGARAAFKIAFAVGVQNKVERLNPSLIEQTQINAYMKKHFGAGLEEVPAPKHRRTVLDQDSWIAGATAAHEFSIHMPVEGRDEECHMPDNNELPLPPNPAPERPSTQKSQPDNKMRPAPDNKSTAPTDNK